MTVSWHFFVIIVAGGLFDDSKLTLFFVIIVAGGLFDDSEDDAIENAFCFAIYRINLDKSLLSHTKFVYDIQHLPDKNSFVASKKGQCLNSLTAIVVFNPYY